jgi:hypothetical protein
VLVLIGCITSVLGKQVLFRFFSVAVVLLLLVPPARRDQELVADTLQLWTAHICNYLLALRRRGNHGLRQHAADQRPDRDDRRSLQRHADGLPSAADRLRLRIRLPLNNVTRLLIVLMSPFVALLCNVLRVLPLIWLQGQGSIGRDWGTALHDGSGWFMVTDRVRRPPRRHPL